MPENGSQVAPFENFLIVFKEDVSVYAIRRLVRTVKDAGGGVLLVAGNGKALIITASQPVAERIRRLPYISHVGGVRIGQRKIVRKRM